MRKTAQTPNTFIRKIWDIVQRGPEVQEVPQADGSKTKLVERRLPFTIISAWRGRGWSVSPEEAKGRNLHPQEYVGEPDPARDLHINQKQDARLRSIVKNLRLQILPLNGLGQEIGEDGSLGVSTERSYLIVGLSLQQAESLDRAFNQDYFVYGIAGRDTTCYGWDREHDTFEVAVTWSDVATYKDKSVSPNGEDYEVDTPGTAQYRSDSAKGKGVGYVFYNASDAIDAISSAVDRLKAKGEQGLPSKATIERAWMDMTKRAEDAATALDEAGDASGAELARGKVKQLAEAASRDPEGMVRLLVEQTTPAAVA